MTYLYTVIASSMVALLGWAFGIEPRIQVIAQKQTDLKELISSQLTDIGHRLDRIERSLNGALRKDS